MYKIVFDEAIKKDLKKLDKQTLKILFNWIEKNGSLSSSGHGENSL